MASSHSILAELKYFCPKIGEDDVSKNIRETILEYVDINTAAEKQQKTLQNIQSEYHRIMRQTELKLGSSSPSSGHSFIQLNIPRDEIWRYGVEWHRQHKGLYAFEGGKANYFKAFGSAFLKIDGVQRLSVKLIREMHYYATYGAQDIQKRSMPGFFRIDANNTVFRCYSNTFTLEGIQETLEKMRESKKDDVNYNFYLKQGHDYVASSKKNKVEDLHSLLESGMELVFRPVVPQKENVPNRSTIWNIMECFIERYQLNLSQAKNNLERLKAIVAFIRDCNQLHPFADGNCRTFSMCVLQHLLLQNGFPPALIEDANKFEGHSVHEMVDLVIAGMEETLKLAKGKKYLHGVTTNDLLTKNPKDLNIAKTLFFMRGHPKVREAIKKDSVSAYHAK